MIKAIFFTSALSGSIIFVQASQCETKTLKQKQRRFENKELYRSLDSTKVHYPRKAFYHERLIKDDTLAIGIEDTWEVCKWEPIAGSSSYRLTPLGFNEILGEKSPTPISSLAELIDQGSKSLIPSVIWQTISEFAYDMPHAEKVSDQKLKPQYKRHLAEMSAIDRNCRQNLIMDDKGVLRLDGFSHDFSRTSYSPYGYGKTKFELARYRCVNGRNDDIHLEWQVCVVEYCTYVRRSKSWKMELRPYTTHRKLADHTYDFGFHDLSEISHRFQRLKEWDIVVDANGEEMIVFSRDCVNKNGVTDLLVE